MYRINLIPKDRKERIRPRRLLGTILVIILFAAIIFNFTFDSLQIRSLENEIAAIERERRTLGPLVAEAERLEREIAQLKEQNFFDEVFYPRTSLVEAIKEFSGILTREMNLRQFNLTKDGQLTLVGDTRDHEKVSVYMDNLYDSIYFHTVTLIQSSSSWGDDGVRRTVFDLNIGVEESGVEE